MSTTYVYECRTCGKLEILDEPLGLNEDNHWPFTKSRCHGMLLPVEIPMKDIDEKVMARLRPPFTCEYIAKRVGLIVHEARWRIADASGGAIASCAAAEEGYARLIVQALNEHFERRGKP